MEDDGLPRLRFQTRSIIKICPVQNYSAGRPGWTFLLFPLEHTTRSCSRCVWSQRRSICFSVTTTEFARGRIRSALLVQRRDAVGGTKTSISWSCFKQPKVVCFYFKTASGTITQSEQLARVWSQEKLMPWIILPEFLFADQARRSSTPSLY